MSTIAKQKEKLFGHAPEENFFDRVEGLGFMALHA